MKSSSFFVLLIITVASIAKAVAEGKPDTGHGGDAPIATHVSILEKDNVQWYYDGKPLEDGLRSVFATSQLHSMLSSAASATLEPRRLLNPRTGSAVASA